MRFLAILLGFTLSGAAETARTRECDLCIYGGTVCGIAAAVQAARMGHDVVLLEPGRRIGGMTTGGLGATDIGNKAAIGGIAREFYRALGRHYGAPEAWNFEPHAAAGVLEEMLRNPRINVLTNTPLGAVVRSNGRIEEIRTTDGTRFRAKMFIDASYEGDLMAKAGISYTIGREGNSLYGETLNGIRAETPKHQFTARVDPYIRPGDPTSGLVRFVQSDDEGKPGEGDRRVQTYNYRLCFTTNAANRLPIERPAQYDPADFELLARYLEALVAAGQHPQMRQFWNPVWLPNGKADINNNGGFSTDFIGRNYDYPAGDEATRARIRREHLEYTKGFCWFMATDPRVPANLRADIGRFGPCKDEFQDSGGWSTQIYVREARRMVTDHVMTEHNCRGETIAPDAVGLAAYTMDSHNCRRIVVDGAARNEGDVQVPPMKPYPVSYRAIVPRGSECQNLFVPVCLAASHIAYGSIRMEPVFMILGQSAATAGCMAIEENVPVQSVDQAKLRARLLADHQILDWPAP